MKFSFLFLIILVCSFSVAGAATSLTWETPMEPGKGFITAIAAVGTSSPQIVLIGTESQGILRSTDNGATWSTTSVSAMYIFAFASSPQGTLLAGTQEHGLYRSTDKGVTWEPTGTEIEDLTILSLAISSNGTIFAGTSAAGVYYSSDDGISWHYAGLSGNDAKGMGISPDGQVFVGALFGLFRSQTGLSDYTSLPFPSSFLRSVAAGEDHTVFAGTFEWLYSSTDNGENWTKADITIGDVRGIIPIPGQAVYAGGSQGLFRSSDKGATWETLPLAGTVSSVQTIGIDNTGHLLIAGNDGGIANNSILLRSQEKLTRVEETSLQHSFTLGQNLPNPCGRTTAISFELEHAQHVHISFMDLAGIEQVVVLDQFMQQGSHILHCDVSTLQSGLYFYTIATPSGSQSRNCVVLR